MGEDACFTLLDESRAMNNCACRDDGNTIISNPGENVNNDGIVVEVVSGTTTTTVRGCVVCMDVTVMMWMTLMMIGCEMLL